MNWAGKLRKKKKIVIAERKNRQAPSHHILKVKQGQPWLLFGWEIFRNTSAVKQAGSRKPPLWTSLHPWCIWAHQKSAITSKHIHACMYTHNILFKKPTECKRDLAPSRTQIMNKSGHSRRTSALHSRSPRFNSQHLHLKGPGRRQRERPLLETEERLMFWAENTDLDGLMVWISIRQLHMWEFICAGTIFCPSLDEPRWNTPSRGGSMTEHLLGILVKGPGSRQDERPQDESLECYCLSE